MTLKGLKIESLEELIQLIFSELESKKITIRQLSHDTKLSIVSISNFKSGKDLRISNLFKILKALNLGIQIRDESLR